MNHNAYILVADDEEILRETYASIVESTTGTEVVQVPSGNAGIAVIRARGAPRFVLADFRMPDGDGADLGRFCHEQHPEVPFVLCSGSPEDELRAALPTVSAVLLKPSVFKPLQALLENLESLKPAGPAAAPAPAASQQQQFAPFRISLFVRVALLRYDIYLRLGAEKFVKIAHEGDIFTPEDAGKLFGKKVSHVYLKGADVASFLSDLQSAVHVVQPEDEPLVDPAMASLGLEIAEAASGLARELGWSESVVRLAQQGSEMALRFVAREKTLERVMAARLKDPSSRYSEHISNLVLVTAHIAKAVGWDSDFTMAKLCLAALLHDASLPESTYEEDLNKRAADPSVRDPEIVVFREHPLRAAEMIRRIPNMPTDLDQIVLQHHESPGLGGYPLGLNFQKISPLAALFIVAQDLEEHLAAAPSPAEGLDAFFRARASHYTQGNFKKIFTAIAVASADLAA